MAEKKSIPVTELIKIILVVVGILGGVVGVGDRLYAKKTAVAVIKERVQGIQKDVTWIRKVWERGIEDSKVK